MVAKTPLKQRNAVAPPLDPACLRETLVKVDKCIARLQELQSTVAGVGKVGGGMSLSPRMSLMANRLRTSLRCKQVSPIRIKNNPPSRSQKEKFPTSSPRGELRRMSLKGMLVGETMAKILQASKFAGDVIDAVADKIGKRFRDDPRSSPITPCKSQRLVLESGDIRTRRNLEKQNSLSSSDPCSPSLHSTCSRIDFKVSPPKQRDFDKGNTRYMANRVSPGNKSWVKSTSTKQQTFMEIRSRPETPHKFLGKSLYPHSKYQVKIKSPPKRSAATTAVLRRSYSLSRLANRLTSPLRGRRSIDKSDD